MANLLKSLIYGLGEAGLFFTVLFFEAQIKTPADELTPISWTG